MRPFDYLRPDSIEAAVAAAQAPDAAYLAGGTNLLDLMKGDVMRPARIVDITHLPALNGIERDADGGAWIGALVRNADLAFDDTFAHDFPAVAEALLSGASPQLRNAATVGGNLMQRTRCAYFQNTASACNRRAPGSGCDALDGLNANHAVLGWNSACIATHPSDFCVALAALDATVEIAGPEGRRSVALTDFHRLPGDDPADETVLARGELVVGVRLPAEAATLAWHSRYLKVRERTSYAFALVSAAVGLAIDAQGTITDARIALGGVAAKPWRARVAEAGLIGARGGVEAYAAAGRAAFAEARPSGDNTYKIRLGQNIVARALARAAAGTPRELPALPGSPFATEAGELAHV